MPVILSRLLRNRRRLAVAVLLSVVAGFLMYARHPGMAHGVPLAWMTAALYAAFVGAAGLLVCLALPGIRFTVELFALSRLIFAAWVCCYPGTGLTVAMDPFLNATIVVTGGIVLASLGHSPLCMGLWTSGPRVETVRLTTAQDTRSVWQALLAAPPDLAALNYSPRGPGPSRCLHDVLGRAPDFGTLTPAAAARTGTAVSRDGRRRITVEDKGDRRLVTITVHRGPLPLPTRLALWLDDAEARVCDHALRARSYSGSTSPDARMA